MRAIPARSSSSTNGSRLDRLYAVLAAFAHLENRGLISPAMAVLSSLSLQKDFHSPTIEDVDADWPCPSQSYSSARRPSWQESLSAETIPGGLSKHQAAIKQMQFSSSSSDRKLASPRPSSASSTSTLRPLSATFSTYQPSATSSASHARPAFVSPFTIGHPVISKSQNNLNVSQRSPTTPSSDDESSTFSPSSVSSPGLATPLSQDPNWMTPFEAAFHKKVSMEKLNMPAETPVSPRSFLSKGMRLAPTPEMTFMRAPLSTSSALSSIPPSFMNSEAGKKIRRRSVDVGMLVNARGHQKSGRTTNKDAPAAAFLPPDQLRAQRAHRQSSQRNRESL